VTRWDDTSAPRGDDYDDRWRRLEASGAAIHGEADLVAGYAPRAVLDAGCGTGRVAIELARRGVATVGVDLDAGMLDTARRKAPELAWVRADLLDAAVAAPGHDGPGGFDVVVAAGNVFIFLTPGTEAAVTANLAHHLVPGGRLIAGFQLGAGRLPLADHDAHCAAAGLVLEDRWATWARDPYAGGDYAVSVHRRPAAGEA
jgi:SAM-dependent methyltransferase